MLTKVLAVLSVIICSAGMAAAQSCGSIPNTLTNGQNADATQVMANFNFLKDCVNNLPPATIDDATRRNILLNTASLSKLNAGYVRNISAFADGYKASDGVNAGTSLNFALNTASGYVAPSSAVATNFSYTLTTDNASNWSGYTIRSVVDTAQITYGSGTAFTITLEAPSATTIALDAVYACVLSGSYGCAAAPVQVLFGGSGSLTIAAGQSVTSDSLTLTGLTTGNSVVFATHQTTSTYRVVAASGSNKMWYKNANDASNQSPTGYNDGTSLYGGAPVTVKKMVQGGTAVNNMTLVTTAQTADATVSKARVLLEYNPVDSTTINTDLTVDVSCNGGTNWTAATLAAAGSAQAGHKVTETADTTCGTTGTSFAARIKTLNTKNIQIFKSAVVVH